MTSLIRAAWYFQAYTLHPAASVFVTKSPPFLLNVSQLAHHFRDAKFLVRTPYAVCKGICCYCTKSPEHVPVRNLPEPLRTMSSSV